MFPKPAIRLPINRGNVDTASLLCQDVGLHSIDQTHTCTDRRYRADLAGDSSLQRRKQTWQKTDFGEILYGGACRLNPAFSPVLLAASPFLAPSSRASDISRRPNIYILDLCVFVTGLSVRDSVRSCTSLLTTASNCVSSLSLFLSPSSPSFSSM